MVDLTGTNSDDTLFGGAVNDTLFGGDGNDSLDGREGNDLLLGGAGDDLIDGSAGNINDFNQPTGDDTLSGGSGSDTLRGGGGNDTYLYNRGDGYDEIQDYYYFHERISLGSIRSPVELDGGTDTIRFGAGITYEDLWVSLDGDDLIIGIRDGDTDLYGLSDLLRLNDADNPLRAIEQIQFEDGTTIDVSGLVTDLEGSGQSDTVTWDGPALGIDAGGGDDTITATDAADTIGGGAGNDVVNAAGGDNQIDGGDGDDAVVTGAGVDSVAGGSGQDTVSVGGGNDRVDGGDGDDSVLGGTGDDTLVGGIGNDTLDGSAEAGTTNEAVGHDHLSGGVGDDLLRGGGGNDVYSFNLGDGQDTIVDEYKIVPENGLGHVDNAYVTDGGADRIVFGPGIGAEDLWFDIIGDDLVIGIRDGVNELGDLADQITIENWRDSDYRIETLEFDDGSELSVEDITANLDGTSADESLSWTDTALGVDAAGGNDTVVAGAADDTVSGGDGNDLLVGGGGNDVVDGGADNDSIRGGVGNDTARGGDGNDTIDGGDGNDLLSGGAGADTLLGSGGIRGAAIAEPEGDDTLVGGEGNDLLRAGGGDDVYQYASGDGRDRIIDEYWYQTRSPLGHIGTPTLLHGGIDTLELSDLNAEDVTLWLNGSTLYLAAAEDAVGWDSISDMVEIDYWTDTLRTIENIEFADGSVLDRGQVSAAASGVTAGNDTVSWSGPGIRLDGGAGADSIQGGSGRDYLEGGSGNDTLNGGGGDDTLEGDGGNDVLVGGAGSDRLDGGAGSDTLTGGAGGDVFVAGDGDVIADLGDDDVVRVEGVSLDADAVELVRSEDGTTTGIRIDTDGDGNADLTLTLEGDFNDVEAVTRTAADGSTYTDFTIRDQGPILATGGDGNDVLTGGAAADTLSGAGGDDTVLAGGGEDTVDGGDGNDLLSGGEGADTLDGGAGNDTVAGGADNDLLSGNEGEDALAGGDGDDTLYGGPSDDSLTGGAGDDELLGEAADDSIQGNDGADLLSGGGGNDTLDGGEGADTLRGSDGDDLLSGGAGADDIDGDGGDDALVGGAGSDSLAGGAGADTFAGTPEELDGDLIRDFAAGVDVISVAGVSADTLGVTLVRDETGSTLSLDTDGDGTPDSTIRLDGLFTSPTVTDNGSGGVDISLEAFEPELGTDGADTLVGTPENDTIEAGDGDDDISAKSAGDVVSGGGGDDTLSGQAGDDTLSGGDGNDSLLGGEDDDIALGGDGDDTAEGGSGDDTLSGGIGNDAAAAGHLPDAAVGVQETVLVVPELDAFGERRRYAALDPLPILRVDEVVPAFAMRRGTAGGMAEDRLEVGADPDGVAEHVPVPHHVGGGARDRPEAFLAVAQPLDREMTLGDVGVDHERTGERLVVQRGHQQTEPALVLSRREAVVALEGRALAGEHGAQSFQRRPGALLLARRLAGGAIVGTDRGPAPDATALGRETTPGGVRRDDAGLLVDQGDQRR
nr:calcium-binding protein [Thalassobaculum salexigens]